MTLPKNASADTPNRTLHRRLALDRIGAMEKLRAIPPEKFLNDFRESASECLVNVYLIDRTVTKSDISGTLYTSLPEDVFALLEAQASLLDDYLISTELYGTDAGDAILTDALFSILRNLWYKQSHFRNSFLWDMESCIAAANDLLRMVDKVDALVLVTAERYPHLNWNESGDVTTSLLRKEAASLISLLGNDAVNASQRAVNFVMRDIQRSDIPQKLFDRDWEDRLVQNEVAMSMVRMLEAYISDIRGFIEQDFLFHKVVAALVRSTVCFYVQRFVNKADQMRRAMKRDFGNRKTRRIAFMSSSRATCRMNYDIEVLREYFGNIAKDIPSLGRVVDTEFSVFELLLECMWLAVGQTSSEKNNLEEFVVVVHKRTGADSQVTRHFLSDLWLLMGAKNQHQVVEETIRMMDADLQLLSTRLKEVESSKQYDNNDMTCVRLDEMLKASYQERILQEKSSVCGNILKNAKDLRDDEGEEHHTSTLTSKEEPSRPKWHNKFDGLKQFFEDQELEIRGFLAGTKRRASF